MNSSHFNVTYTSALVLMLNKRIENDFFLDIIKHKHSLSFPKIFLIIHYIYVCRNNHYEQCHINYQEDIYHHNLQSVEDLLVLFYVANTEKNEMLQ